MTKYEEYWGLDMDKPTKCMFTIRSLTGGGAERVVSVLANAMVKQGIDTYIVTYARTDRDYDLDKNVKVIVMPKRKDSIYTKMQRIPDMYKIIHKINPDIVIPFVGTVLYVTWIACLGLKCKFILTVRNNPWVVPESKKERLLRNYIAGKSDAIMIQNEEQGEYFSEALHKNLIVVNNPISQDFINNAKENYTNEVCTVVTAGRLEPQKDHAFLIKAFAKSFADKPQIKLYIYGEGKLKQKLETLIEELSLQDRVFLMGRAINIGEVLQKADLFVMTSKYEGMPNALMEAMMVGVPCISSDCKTGPCSLINNQVNGLLYSNGNETDLIEKFKWCVSNPQQLSSIGKEARRFMLENYTEAKIAESIDRIKGRMKSD